MDRHVTAAINHQGGGGVLVGNWTNDPGMEDPEVDHPANARPPTSWQGSVEILTQWVRTNRAVCYGQCWVFGGITCSVIPYSKPSTLSRPRVRHAPALQLPLGPRHAQQPHD